MLNREKRAIVIFLVMLGALVTFVRFSDGCSRRSDAGAVVVKDPATSDGPRTADTLPADTVNRKKKGSGKKKKTESQSNPQQVPPVRSPLENKVNRP